MKRVPARPGRHPAASGEVIRRIGYTAREELHRHMLRLTPYQRRMRFNGGVNDEFIRTYCRGFAGARSVVLGYYAENVLRGAGELIVRTDVASHRSCEVALSVESPYQGRGIGTGLVRRLLVLASNRRIRRMHALYMAGNKRMDNIARRLDAAINSGGPQVEAVIAVSPPDDLSIFQEAMIHGARRLTADQSGRPDSAPVA